MTEADLKTMKLHESKKIDEITTIFRVANGWIYTFSEINMAMFVPEMTVTQEYVLPRK